MYSEFPLVFKNTSIELNRCNVNCSHVNCPSRCLLTRKLLIVNCPHTSSSIAHKVNCPLVNYSLSQLPTHSDILQRQLLTDNNSTTIAYRQLLIDDCSPTIAHPTVAHTTIAHMKIAHTTIAHSAGLTLNRTTVVHTSIAHSAGLSLSKTLSRTTIAHPAPLAKCLRICQ